MANKIINSNPKINGTLCTVDGNSNQWSAMSSWAKPMSECIGSGYLSTGSNCIIWGNTTPVGNSNAPAGSVYVYINGDTAVPFINVGTGNTGWKAICLA